MEQEIIKFNVLGQEYVVNMKEWETYDNWFYVKSRNPFFNGTTEEFKSEADRLRKFSAWQR